jgi:peptide/nickel transport system ATP-binding protein
MPTPAVLTVASLDVHFPFGQATVPAVQDMSYSLFPGETLALIGASGSGKSASCRAVLGLLPMAAAISGSVKLLGRELLGQREPVLRAARRTDLGFVAQDSGRSLDPTMSVGNQLAGAARLRERLGRREARDRATELLEVVGLPSSGRRYDAFPHELSGGMRQRVAIALALTGQPKVLIADEPTTALDVRTKAQILELLASIQADRGLAMVLVSHDLGVVAGYASRVIVMQHGRVVARADIADIFGRPENENTRRVLTAAGAAIAATTAVRRSEERASSPSADPPRPVLIEARGIVQDFSATRRQRTGDETDVSGVAGVSMEIREGEILGLIGESGAGKSTLANSLLFSPRPPRGEVWLRGVNLDSLTSAKLREARRDIQMVLQDPGGSLDPPWKVSRIVEEPLRIHAIGARRERRHRVDDVRKLVGLEPGVYSGRRRHQLSGGEAQRVAIARALAVSPSLLVCDEPVSSLDLNTRQEITVLLERLRTELHLSCLLIVHDLDLVSQITDRTAVIYRGKLCEVGPTDAVIAAPFHPHSAELRLWSKRTHGAPAVPDEALSDQSSLPHDGSSGCGFRSRCSRAAAVCMVAEPKLRLLAPDHTVACHFPLNRSAAVSGIATPWSRAELATHR